MLTCVCGRIVTWLFRVKWLQLAMNGSKPHCNGCRIVALDLFWGRCRTAKHGVFSCKVAAASDEGLCAVVAGRSF